mgnify:CR=1 FL=1|jgi:hypothetical protein
MIVVLSPLYRRIAYCGKNLIVKGKASPTQAGCSSEVIIYPSKSTAKLLIPYREEKVASEMIKVRNYLVVSELFCTFLV